MIHPIHADKTCSSRYDEDLSLWKATHQAHKEFLATSSAKKSSLLLGRHDWTVHNDSKSCSLATSYTTVLKLTGCSKEEFTCDDGSCVSMTDRCNGKRDCLDETDEAECKAFVQSLGYNRFAVPPPAENETKHVVYYSFDIQGINEINEKGGFYRCKILIIRRWFDRNIIFQNLENNPEQNVINPEDRSLLWKPWMIFNNIEDRRKYAQTDREEEWKVLRNPNKSFVRADNSFLHNTYLFDGASHMISYEKASTVEWLCDFHMHWFPFDTQSCKMEFLTQDDSVLPVPQTVVFSGSDLPQHVLKTVAMCATIIDGNNGIVVEIILGRPIFSSFLLVNSFLIAALTLNQFHFRF